VIIFSRVFHMLTGFGLSINGRHHYCGDYLYSGHTVILTICYLFLREYFVPARCRTWFWKFVKLTLLSSSVIGVIAILVSRGHYLIDILLAYYITTRIFWIYHTLAYNYSLRIASPSNYLSQVWWWYLFKYFECVPHEHKGAPCEPLATGPKSHVCNCDTSIPAIPRVFEWPFPRWARRRTNRCRQRLLPTPPLTWAGDMWCVCGWLMMNAVRYREFYQNYKKLFILITKRDYWEIYYYCSFDQKLLCDTYNCNN